MGLFCGKKCRCKRNCKSWFTDPSDLKGCKASCKAGNYPESAYDYLYNIQSEGEEEADLSKLIQYGGIIIMILLIYYLYKKR